MKELLYTINPQRENHPAIVQRLRQHSNVKFVSLVAVDLGNNHTDEKIPIAFLLNDCDNFLKNGIQTDGSSVYLPKIAEINNAKVDLIPDLSVNWFVDYNWDNLDTTSNLPIGTLIIPSFLRHEGRYVDSRAILKRAIEHFESKIITLINNNPIICDSLKLDASDKIDKINLTVATELEFWVKTPDYTTDIEKLSTSQSLKEQYWKRTVGPVRTAMEKSILALEKFGLEPEMGHKEVGGVQAKLKRANDYSHIMEQLEIDWKYNDALQTADNEIIAKNIISDVFVREGLEVTFRAKPIDSVAGSGEHHHLGVSATTKSGRYINLFSPIDMKKDYLSPIGYGALMGILNNYEVINPFVASTNDAFNRLKPGFEAPTCIVGSLGHTITEPSRNRTILIGLVREIDNSNATRFELRSPNPTSNTYLLTAACYQAMLDGITYALESKKNSTDLYNELTKLAGDSADYLAKDRQYICEEDVFEDYTLEQRNALFAKPPSNVYENLKNFDQHANKVTCLIKGKVFSKTILASFKATLLSQWATELSNRLLPETMEIVRQTNRRHASGGDIVDLDIVRWEQISKIRHELMKDHLDQKSIFTQIREAIEAKDYSKASKLQLKMVELTKQLSDLYHLYKQNLIIVE